MSTIKISQLPTYTGSVAGTYFVIDNPTLTETYKVLRENIVGSSGTSGTSGFNGANGTSGSSGTSGISGSAGSNGLGISTKAGSTDGTGWTFDNTFNNWTKTITFSSPFGSTNYTINAVYKTASNDGFSCVRTGFSGVTTNGFVAIVGSSNVNPPTNYQYTATAFQETGVPGTSGTSGTSGSSGTSGIIADSIFAQTGSVWNTTNNVGITGSFFLRNTAVTNANLSYDNSFFRVQNANGNFLLSSGTSVSLSNSGLTESSFFSQNQMFFTSGSNSGSIVFTNNKLAIRANTLDITGSVIVTGSLITTGSISGNHIPISIVSNTASLNLNNGTFFTVTLPGSPSSASTHILPTNVRAGQTINILIDGSAATLPIITFPSYVKQVSGSAYTPASNAIDIVTLISFTSSSLYLGSIKNYI